ARGKDVTSTCKTLNRCKTLQNPLRDLCDTAHSFPPATRVQRRLWLGGGQGTVTLTDAKPQAVDSHVNLQKQRRGAACCAPTGNPPAESLLEPPAPERRRRREQLFGHRRRHGDE